MRLLNQERLVLNDAVLSRNNMTQVTQKKIQPLILFILKQKGLISLCSPMLMKRKNLFNRNSTSKVFQGLTNPRKYLWFIENSVLNQPSSFF